MPARITPLTTAGELHPTPFLGPINHTAAIPVDVSQLDSNVVDKKGFLKPGVLLTRNGRPVSAGSVLSGPNLRAGSNAGKIRVDAFNAAVNGVQVAKAAQNNIDVTQSTVVAAGSHVAVLVQMTAAGAVSTLASAVYDTEAEALRALPVPAANRVPVGYFVASGVTLNATALAAANSTFYNFAYGDEQGFGAVVEAVKVAKSNSATDLLAAIDIEVAVATICMINRDILEDAIGRSLTLGERANIRDSIVILNT